MEQTQEEAQFENDSSHSPTGQKQHLAMQQVTFAAQSTNLPGTRKLQWTSSLPRKWSATQHICTGVFCEDPRTVRIGGTSMMMSKCVS